MTNDHSHMVCHFQGTVMGGPWHIRHCSLPLVDDKLVGNTAYKALYEIECQMSHFKPDSELMQLNRAPLNEWIPVPEHLFTVLSMANTLGQRTHGALNISLGHTINHWGFGAPNDDTTIDCKHLTGVCTDDHQGFEIDHDTHRARRTRDVHLNLSSIAKGYAVDYASQCVAHLGITDFIIEAAGEVRVQGQRAQQQPWQIGLELPIADKTLVYDTLTLSNTSLASSGNYRKYKEVDGKHLSHAIDPKTHTPLDSSLLCVSVVHERCMIADALATALLVMGAQHGSAYADKHNIAALFLLKDPQGICEIRSQEWITTVAQ